MRLITNARIYTFNSIQPVADAMLLSGNRIVAVGSSKEFVDLSVITEVTDLHQHVVLPGFTDAHIHLLHFAKSLRKALAPYKNLTTSHQITPFF